MNFSQTSYEFLTNFLVNFLQTLINFYKLITKQMNFLWFLLPGVKLLIESNLGLNF